MPNTTHERCRAIRDRLYPREQWPGVVFERVLAEAGGPDRTLLELGCGRDARLLRRLAPHYGFAWGVDLEVAATPAPGERWELRCGDAHRIPLGDAGVDVVAMKNVLEHLERPAEALAECARVLRPGGQLVALTVNQWFPPIALARMLPHRVRQRLNHVASGTAPDDTFPAVYRANTARRLVNLARQAGLRPVGIDYLSTHPHYLMFSVTAYRLGVLLERVVRRLNVLRHWRQFLYATFVRPTEELSCPTTR